VSEFTATEVHKRCLASGVPVAPILDVAGIFAVPQIVDREALAVWTLEPSGSQVGPSHRNSSTYVSVPGIVGMNGATNWRSP
jgi:crotonobetainyl-CoA:carnitine CoA-transferase CaiB-like acyl-CoA transferase